MPAPVLEQIEAHLEEIEAKLDQMIVLLNCIRECERAEWTCQTGGDEIPHINPEEPFHE